MRILLAVLGAALLVVPGGSAQPVTRPAQPGPSPTVAAPPSGTGTVALSIPPVVFTADDGWPQTLRRGRAVRGELRFAAGPGTVVTDVTVTARGGSIDCPATARDTVEFVTTLSCRLRGGAPSRPSDVPAGTTVVTIEVTTPSGTTSRSWSHVVTD